MRRQLALLCTILLMWSSSALASGVSQATTARKQSLKEQATQTPNGSVVEVRLANNQKIRGRLGSINDSGFELQHIRNDRVVTETLAFDNVKSVKVIGQGWSTGKKILVGTLVGAGVLFVIGCIGIAAGGGL